MLGFGLGVLDSISSYSFFSVCHENTNSLGPYCGSLNKPLGIP